MCKNCSYRFCSFFINKGINKIQVIRTLKWIKRKKKRLGDKPKVNIFSFQFFIQSFTTVQAKRRKKDRRKPKCQRFKRFYDNKHKQPLRGTLPINNFDQYLWIEAARRWRIDTQCRCTVQIKMMIKISLIIATTSLLILA